MLELWQTEWCPASRRVRQRLTELGVDYLALAYLDARFEQTAGANAHREKAANARRRDLEEACTCSQPATP